MTGAPGYLLGFRQVCPTLDVLPFPRSALMPTCEVPMPFAICLHLQQKLRKEMPVRMKIIMLSSFLLALTTSVAMAAPYCAVFAWGKQCDYVDYKDCLRAAGSRGQCVRNQQEDKTSPGTAPFCLVTRYGTKCIYDDAPACRMAASIENSQLIKNAACVENPNR